MFRRNISLPSSELKCKPGNKTSMKQAASKVKKELKKEIVIYLLYYSVISLERLGEIMTQRSQPRFEGAPRIQDSSAHFGQLVPGGERCKRQGKMWSCHILNCISKISRIFWEKLRNTTKNTSQDNRSRRREQIARPPEFEERTLTDISPCSLGGLRGHVNGRSNSSANLTKLVALFPITHFSTT
jgi:hypothetical protein